MASSLPVTITGTVTRFKGHGRQLGYPTANLAVATELRDGIYFGYADLAAFSRQPTLIFVGTPTTMGETVRRVEAHVLDIPDRDYYELPLRLELHHYYRGNQTFQNVDTLKLVLHNDEIAGRAWFVRRKVAIKANPGNT